jgi:hypothetical protein
VRLSPFLLLLGALLLTGPVAGQELPRTLTFADYLALAAETEAVAPTATTAEARALAERWQALEEVALLGGTTIPVHHDALIAALRAGPPDGEAIAAQMAELQAVAVRWANPAYDEAAAASARQRLDDILARPAFQWEDEQPSFWQWLWQRLLRLLFDLIPFGSGAIDLANIVLAVLGGAVLFAALALAARSLLRSIRPEAATAGLDGLEHGLTAAQALQQAEAHSQQGDYRSAVRYLYLSTLLLLEEHGVLRYDRSRTNREYLRSVAGEPELYSTLQSVVDVFDRVWYGFQPLDETAYERYQSQVRALQARRPT